MSLLKHSLLKRLARNIDLGISPLRWIDLYSAQYISDCQQEGYQGEGQQDVVALAVLVSFASSSGETYLSLSNLPKICYRHLNFQISLLQSGRTN